MATKLIGADDATGSNAGGEVFMLNKFTAIATGYMTEFRIKSGIPGEVKVALYADSGGNPGALITAMNTGQAVVAGWNTLNFTSTPVTSGTDYWLAVAWQPNTCQYISGGTRRYKTITYSTFTFPDPAGSGFNSDSYTHLIAGWGVTEVAKTSSDTGSGADAYVSLETGEAKTSSDIGSGVDGTPVQTATIAGNETGSGIEAFVARLLVVFDTGSGVEVAQLVGLLKELFASELGEGCDLLTAKIEMPTKGGGMKLWT